MDQPILHAKLKALGWHFLYSAVLVGCAALFISYWYPDFLFWLDGGIQVLYLIIPIDLVLGPLLMFVVFNPLKSMRERVLDVGVVLILQWVALGYGLWQAYEQRPLSLYFSGTDLSSCPNRWYVKTNSMPPKHPVLEIQALNPNFNNSVKLMDLALNQGVSACVLSADMVPAPATLLRKGEAHARSLLPKSAQSVADHTIAVMYQGRHGEAVLILDAKTLRILAQLLVKK